MAIAVCNAIGNSCGYLRKEGNGWAAIHDAESADSGGNSPAYIRLTRSGEYYNIKRSYLYFDTSTFNFPPEDYITVISRVDMYLYGSGYFYIANSHPVIVLQNGQPDYPRDPLALEDYNYSLYSGNGGSISCPYGGGFGWSYLGFNSTSISWINMDGISKFCLRFDLDIYSNPPSSGGNEYVLIPSYALLRIEYDYVYIPEGGDAIYTDHIIEINKLIDHTHPDFGEAEMITGNDVDHGNRVCLNTGWWHYHEGHETPMYIGDFIGNWEDHLGTQHG